jgi:thiamine-phosphate pyrophosphorylase
VTLNLPSVYPILDTAALDSRGLNPIHAAAAILEGGARIIQFRHKGFWGREVVAVAQAIAALCRGANAPFVVNDRADYAHVLHAGLHLGQDDILPQDARTVVGPDALIGFSTHNPAQMREAQTEPVDYLAFGPIFTTSSKERPDPTVGLAGLRIVRALTRKPLVAIGGITRENASLCWSAGADSVAIIADLLPVPCNAHTVRDRMTEWVKI